MPSPFFPSQRPDYRDRSAVRSELEDLAARVRERRPGIEEVILFGSYATGQAGYFSDLDLLVILSQDDRRPLDRVAEFLLLFRESPLPTDVFVFTRAEIEARLEASDPFITRVMREGVRVA
jgi:predicted nucleotidyltransferase